MAYCIPADLLHGDIPTGTGLDPQKFINDAADEIDSAIGFRYATPIPGTAPRPVLLLLKRINSHLASGRLIMAAAAGGSQDNTHAYGEFLVKSAQESLAAIAAGTVDLPIDADPDMPVKGQAIPLIANVDAVSQVESFYGALTDPTFMTRVPSPYRAAGG